MVHLILSTIKKKKRETNLNAPTKKKQAWFTFQSPSRRGTAGRTPSGSWLRSKRSPPPRLLSAEVQRFLSRGSTQSTPLILEMGNDKAHIECQIRYYSACAKALETQKKVPWHGVGCRIYGIFKHGSVERRPCSTKRSARKSSRRRLPSEARYLRLQFLTRVNMIGWTKTSYVRPKPPCYRSSRQQLHLSRSPPPVAIK